jgi:hypothetical protein
MRIRAIITSANLPKQVYERAEIIMAGIVA